MKSRASLCVQFYQSSSSIVFKKIKEKSQVKDVVVPVLGMRAQTVQIQLPKNFNSDLSIEVFGDPSKQYLISSVQSSSGKKFVLDATESGEMKNRMSDSDLELMQKGFGENDRASYDSPVRNFSEYAGDVEVVVIPAQLIDYSEAQTISVKVITPAPSLKHDVKIVVHARKKLSPRAKKILPLNIIVPKGLMLSRDSSLVRSLIQHLNITYKSTGIELKIVSWREIDTKFLDLEVDYASSPVFSEVTKDIPYGLNILLSRNLYLTQAGDVLGYSPNLPGPSSPAGIRRSGILLRLSQIPQENDHHFAYYWTIEMGNILAHEIGHYLGLSHTYETISSTLFDNIPDTLPFDQNNLMDPSVNRNEYVLITPQQKDVLLAHPIVQEESPSQNMSLRPLE